MADASARLPAWRRYLAAVVLIAAINLAARLGAAALAGPAMAMLFLVGVLGAGVWLGLGPALAAALLAAATYNFFHIEPRFTLAIARPSDVVTFGVFLAVAVATGWLSGRVRDQARNLQTQAASLQVLLDASQALSAAATPQETAQALAAHLSAGTGGQSVVVLLPEGDGLTMAAAPAGLARLSGPAHAAALRAWRGGEAADAGLEGAEPAWRFRPLDHADRRTAVVALRAPWPAEDPLVEALLRQGAAALRRAALAGAAAENQALRDADRLRAALLSSISHDFRTPLSTVLGSATTLLDYEAQLSPAVRRDLLASIREDAERLNRHIGALLDMARLEGGALAPKADWIDVAEIAQAALDRIGGRLAGRRLTVALPADLAPVRGDALLLEQALLNLLENVLAHTPAEAAVRVAARQDEAEVTVLVEDDGPGVPAAAQAQVFDKFRRLDQAGDRTGGLGLGLSIARGFVGAMGGRLSLISPAAQGRGARFEISLPRPPVSA